MDDRFNTTAGWVLFAGIVALGSSVASSLYFRADKVEHSEKMGYFIEGAAEGADSGAPAYDLGTVLAAADPAAGEKLFAKCTACHTATQGGANGIGPNLYATVGEAIGQGKGGYAFSSALSGHGGNWTYENLDAWLTSPKAFANGTKMSFAGLSKPEDRANVIAYLKQQGGGPDFPAAKAPDAAAGGDAAAGPAGDATAAPAAGASPAPGETPSGAAAAGATASPQPAGGKQSPPNN